MSPLRVVRLAQSRAQRLAVIFNSASSSRSRWREKVLNVADVGPTGTGASSNRPDGPGPLRLQGDHDAVSFRNIRLRPLSKSEAEKLLKDLKTTSARS